MQPILWTEAELAEEAALATTHHFEPEEDEPTDCSDDDEWSDDDLCSRCNGSGEGMYDGSTCSSCGGSGTARKGDNDDRWADAADHYWDMKKEESLEW